MKQHIFLINVLFVLLFINKQSCGQNGITPGHSIGQVSVAGDLIVIELHSAALGESNLFDLAGRTLRFSKAGSSYHVTNEPLRWDTTYGVEFTGADVRLQRFTFPFQGNGGVHFPWGRRAPFDSVRH
ncbi:hypothetical protein [Paraflavitalea speifideaquila]|uniref:hypothetical protein n=1 Tax=Paraflavitalea speifideaquila TaxID=3076558 RepID=UPI0028EE1EA4|nr:hypothetical protein [Paraflavitalea speifideiaquila]